MALMVIAQAQHGPQLHAAGPVAPAQLDAHKIEVEGGRKLAAAQIVKGNEHAGAGTGRIP